MKRSLKLLCVGLLAAGLLTACPGDKPKEEPPATAAQTTPKEEPKKEPDAAPAEEAPAVDEANYNKALFERTCVTAKIEDVEKQKAIIAEINARYGFDDTTWTAAAEAMKDKPEVQSALETKMKDCTPEMAEGFAKADGAEGDKPAEDGKEGGDKPKAPAKVWKEGAYSAAVNGGGMQNTKIDIKINADGKVTARLQGKREDKGFSIPATGEIGKDGKFTLSGSQAQNNARVSGTFKSGQITGTITGSVHKKPFKASYNAK